MSKKSDGYFIAKRQMQEALSYRMDLYNKELKNLPQDSESVELHRALKVRLQELEQMYQYVRNGMLWDTRNDKEE